MVRLIHVQAVSLIASRSDRSVEMLISLDYDAPISINESGVVFLELKKSNVNNASQLTIEWGTVIRPTNLPI